MWVWVNHGEHGLKTMKWFHLFGNIWNNITVEFQKIAPQNLKRRRVHLYIARGPGKGAQPLWPGTLKWLKWRIGAGVNPNWPQTNIWYWIFFYEINKIWYFMIFSPELPGLKIRYFQETSSNLPYSGTTKTLPRPHSRKHDFTQHVGFIHNLLLSYRQTSFKNITKQSVWWWVCEVAGTMNVCHVICRPVGPYCFNNQITMNLLNPSPVLHLCSFTSSPVFFNKKITIWPWVKFISPLSPSSFFPRSWCGWNLSGSVFQN